MKKAKTDITTILVVECPYCGHEQENYDHVIRSTARVTGENGLWECPECRKKAGIEDLGL